jgi:hypothetical protein
MELDDLAADAKGIPQRRESAGKGVEEDEDDNKASKK